MSELAAKWGSCSLQICRLLRSGWPSQLGGVVGAISESMSVLDGSITLFVEFEDALFDPHGSLVTLIARGRAFGGATDRGFAMIITVTETIHIPTWSNPMWESFEYDVKLEAASF